MSDFSDQELWEYIREDLPYFDLTTHLLAPSHQEATLSVLTRDDILVAGTNEAARMAELLGCKVTFKAQAGTNASKKSVLLEICGDAKSLHKAWKICQVFLEYACALATKANKMLQKAHSVNQNCEILVTRKSFPFAKRFCMQALLESGVMPHRLGLSESVLIFEQHRAMFEDENTFEEAFVSMKKRCVENKLVIESSTLKDAQKMLQLGADVIQLDKCETDVIASVVSYKNKNFPHAKIIAAGGINMENVALYVQTGVDAVVTSSLYNVGMANLTSVWSKA